MSFLELEALGKAYGGVDVLQGISINLSRGEILGIIGPTGSGKTTLLRLVNLLEAPSSGSIRLDGIALNDLPEKEKLSARRRMAMVFQKPVMFKGSVQENVSYGLKIRGKKDQKIVRSALEAVNLSGYQSRDASSLSGGEIQRVALARALVLQPEILLLDEPTANLDPKSAAAIDSIIQSLAGQSTLVILATHNMLQCKRLASRVAVLMKGRMVAVGEPEEVFDLGQEQLDIAVPW
ncbi:MAG: Trehalose/maltose import ATP-binding protein MalK [Methanosaeta sp. PtaB.Bin018]|jgi:tungstate transport system ATP-binding protein|nr:phosphate ABC transporter ATP-binding protein [Methanothrix sp.]OPX73984.1 MAG: Trehalose/maltose import ATP-binding protein MalK [Methanosaeta sp. PtaB.Bin018]OPY45627.1 MAG: Trehalose/maltose import ATP-binding protein MalK [Methanosaeta sp. PtaU1.Bin016]